MRLDAKPADAWAIARPRRPGGVINLRVLRSSDRVALRALRLKAIENDPDWFMMTPVEERLVERLDIEATLENPGAMGWFFGAFDDAHLLGAVALLTGGPRKTSHLGRVVSLAVDPARRREGVGEALMRRVIDEARTLGLATLRLDVVADNAPGVALYESLGFAPYGREPQAYRDGARDFDLLLMGLKLGRAK